MWQDEQLGLIAGLVTNWDGIRLRMEPMSPQLEEELNKIAGRLQRAQYSDELASIISDLLDLTRSTPAYSYVQELAARYRIVQPPSLREYESVISPVSAPPAPPAPGAPPPPAPPAPGASDLDAGRRLGTMISNASGIATVPVFFATNRAKTPRAETVFSGEPAGELSFGLASVTIPVSHSIGQMETPHWWTLFPHHNEQQRFVTLEGLESLTQSAFAARLEKLAEEADAKDLLIFLHGYNVTFEEGARRAAQIAWDMKFPGAVVLFSWPSAGTTMAYSKDEESAFASADPLAKFLQGLAGGPWRRVHVMAHSMGNRVMLLGLADNPRPQLPLGQVVFAAADVYVPLFQEKFPKLQAAGRLPATSYASNRDLALWFSSKLHWGPRVGLIAGNPFVAAQLDTVDASAVDTGFLGHGYFAGQRSLITDLRMLLDQGLPPKDRGLTAARDYWLFPK